MKLVCVVVGDVSAVVEHNHPYWDKGEWDDTYALGEKNAVEDKKLWEKRIPLLQRYDEKVNG